MEPRTASMPDRARGETPGALAINSPGRSYHTRADTANGKAALTPNGVGAPKTEHHIEFARERTSDAKRGMRHSFRCEARNVKDEAMASSFFVAPPWRNAMSEVVLSGQVFFGAGVRNGLAAIGSPSRFGSDTSFRVE